ncbi:2'-5' RNA ligase [Candidatus Falkowbacteria bacterium RIFOXYB2_FULL_47_14]|uniref:RNA 2',3'-cyclic phosphodiesterase n=1 Tax=Candidatus Falkowbacteria bacterium RIFOXYA2_FULL_47_19 TaxID=1797994 RepID=A0A1F5SMM2_9BACT|nr:MAG: 2'-5' RNA ligase [Candidatus Falkowbacteria bacterium RIFOXYA2_FULL_47_19]OGF35114.1 MAG: 2'-5' RNA ligase [Candidatus Falkowbacteria bacterium RIFOXYC2_FULL_46_15]OGF43168.1 MAG: 2'-5' RNA ligase [Candidatus Falkowbacteria bacterium RIFOXYB2_FULL_47_14]
MKNVKNKRLFIALNLPAEMKQSVKIFLDGIKESIPGVVWAHPLTLHITLHFLGDTGPEQAEKIKMEMQNLSGKYHPMEFALSGRLNAFPAMNNPKILYLELKQSNGNSALSLQKILGKNLSQWIKIDKRPWHPHITIGRIKEPSVFRLPVTVPLMRSGGFAVESFDLMESRLYLAGARYTVVEKFKLSL